MSTTIENLKWRYATKKYDTSKKITKEHLQILKDTISLTPTSFGLQPFKVLFIENPEIRKQLHAVSWGQSPVVDASYLVVFANYNDIDANYIDAYLKNIETTRGVSQEALAPLKSKIDSSIETFGDYLPVWTSKQTYIALGILLNAAAELHIDATPMEGFDKEQYNRILGLTEKGLSASVIAAIGYRHAEDHHQHFVKVRKPETEMFETI
ncbi:NAD(P)H-dependent oxidoreductase [uncultured Bacteroides sp.]|uniref:NAD(P)H-dependent oxidoreductase n=1 Tax=uncultured Bacteroides sp. TaxID=162156 RepID=UPI002AA6670D|nr:NAD(P)H-dependent oxidoreductase [uncultured Bacteroides sp.]